MTITVKTISVTYDRKFNLSDFNSLHLSYTVWADVSEDQDLHEANNGLWEMARENVRAQALPVVQKQVATAKEVFLGLPVELRLAMKAATGGDYGISEDDDPGADHGHGSMPHEFGDQ